MYSCVTFGGSTYSSKTAIRSTMLSLVTLITKVRQEKLEEYELAIRAWANQAPRVAEAVRQVYQRRSDFVRGFFTRLGFQGTDEEIRTCLTRCYLSWERNMYEDDSAASRLELLELQHELLTKKS